jgi:Tol biopolymer transport system component
VSPNERWIAFDSNRTGRAEVYVRELLGADGPEWPLTTGGACCPVWARDGSELYYWKRTGQTATITAVPIRPGPTFSWGTKSGGAG